MTDPRNIAHDKKVQKEKKHRGEEVSPGSEHAVQPGKKPHMQPSPDAADATPEALDKEVQSGG